jgi:SAM-dependent methyltransferase
VRRSARSLTQTPDPLSTPFEIDFRQSSHRWVPRSSNRAGRGGSSDATAPFARGFTAATKTRSSTWNPDLIAYWRRFGESIGAETTALSPPSSAGALDVRAVRIGPAAVRSIVPRNVNIVFERLDPLPPGERFDLVVATNTLVYYDVFEQMLALVNVGAVLRPGGVFLSNTPVPPVAPMILSDRCTTVVYSDRQRDVVFAYTRQ